ncbi:MAG: hypothetical protein H7841_07250 [Magnetospirillum sp. WYHS-4]
MTETRRLSDAIVAALEAACTENRREVADLLMEALELDLSVIGGKMVEHRDSVDYAEKAFNLYEKTFGH